MDHLLNGGPFTNGQMDKSAFCAVKWPFIKLQHSNVVVVIEIHESQDIIMQHKMVAFKITTLQA